MSNITEKETLRNKIISDNYYSYNLGKSKNIDDEERFRRFLLHVRKLVKELESEESQDLIAEAGSE